MSFAIAGAVLTIGAGAYGAREAGKAADAQVGATRDATSESARQFDITNANLASGRSLYEGANSLLGQLYGIPIQSSQQFQNVQPQLVGDTELPAGTTTKDVGNGWYEVHYNGQRIGTLRPGGANGRFINDTGADIPGLLRQAQQQGAAQLGGGTAGQPNMSSFFTSPDYNFRRNEGTRDIQQSFAARGGGQSGNALRALAEFNSNLASGEFGNYFNRLTTLAGLGSAATNQTAAYGANAASQAGRNALIAGDARASGVADRTNAVLGGAQNLAGLWGYLGNRPRPVGGGGADWQNFYFGGGG